MTNRKTLLLSQGYQFVRKISPYRAICMFYLGKVDIVEEYGEIIKSQSLKIKMPAVVRLRHRVKYRPMKIKFSRANVYVRDNNVCQYCGNEFNKLNLTLDHVIPKSFGGITQWTNIVTCCKSCNIKKANRTPHQAGMRLISKPGHPSYKMLYLDNIAGTGIPKEWENWLFQ